MSGQSGTVDYAAALRQYSRYGRGRSMKKFCEDEGYDYWKFCKLARGVQFYMSNTREGQLEMGAKSGMSGTDIKSGFIEISPDGTRSPVAAEEPMKVCEIRIRFNNGLVLSRRGGDVEDVISAIRKIPS